MGSGSHLPYKAPSQSVAPWLGRGLGRWLLGTSAGGRSPPAHWLRAGDLVLLAAGSAVPADCYVNPSPTGLMNQTEIEV